MNDYEMDYMMGGSDLFLTRGEAWEFGKLFLCEGDVETVKPDTVLFLRNDTYYVIWTWEKAHPLKTEVHYLKGQEEVDGFLASYDKKVFPLISCEQVESADEDFDIIHSRLSFRRDIRGLKNIAETGSLMRIVLAAFEERGICTKIQKHKNRSIRDSYCDENITVGTASELGPFSYNGWIDYGGSVYITSPDFSIAVPISGGQFYALTCNSKDYEFKSPEHLIASTLGTEMIEFDDFGLPEEYRHDEKYYKKLDEYCYEFELIDEDACDSDFPVKLYVCRFSNGCKVTIRSRAEFYELIRDWIKWRKPTTLYMSSYSVVGDW